MKSEREESRNAEECRVLELKSAGKKRNLRPSVGEVGIEIWDWSRGNWSESGTNGNRRRCTNENTQLLTWVWDWVCVCKNNFFGRQNYYFFSFFVSFLNRKNKIKKKKKKAQNPYHLISQSHNSPSIPLKNSDPPAAVVSPIVKHYHFSNLIWIGLVRKNARRGSRGRRQSRGRAEAEVKQLFKNTTENFPAFRNPARSIGGGGGHLEGSLRK